MLSSEYKAAFDDAVTFLYNSQHTDLGFSKEKAIRAAAYVEALAAATSTTPEGLACLVEKCGCDGSAPCGQDDTSECVPAVRVQCVECVRLDTSDCLYADEHIDDDGCWFDARNASRPKVDEPTVPTSEAVREALERLRQAAEGLRGWERIDGTEAMDEEYHTRVAQLDAEAVATIDRFIRGGDGDAE